MAEEHSFQLPIVVPLLDPEFKSEALTFANDFHFDFKRAGKVEDFTPGEVNDKILRDEAKRINSLPTNRKREDEIFGMLWQMTHAMRMAQKLLQGFLAHDDALAGFRQFLTMIEEVRLKPPESPPPASPQS